MRKTSRMNRCSCCKYNPVRPGTEKCARCEREQALLQQPALPDQETEIYVTERFLLEGRSGSGGWKKAQLALLGVTWPPPKGWKSRVLGQHISREVAERFLALRTRNQEKTLFDGDSAR